MRLTTLTAAFATILAASALAITTTDDSAICSCDTSPSVGATLFKQANPTSCGNIATDYTTVPTAQGCFNMNSMYGNWEESVQALVVAKGMKCEFYMEFDCPAKSEPLCLGSKSEPVVEKVLPEKFARKVRSVQCRKL